MGHRIVAKWVLAGVGVVAGLRLLAACSGADDSRESNDSNDPNDAEFAVARSELTRNLNPQVPTEDQITLAADNAAFACDLYAQVRAQPGNLVVSPHSISTALAMAYAGARGSTAEEMAATLHFTLPGDRLHAAFNLLDLELSHRFDGVTLENGTPALLRVANSLWAQEGFPVLPDFLDVLAVNYGAGVRLLDFGTDPEGARGVINEWTDDATEHRIPELLPAGAIQPLVTLVLTNAIYLHAPWAHPFEPSSTYSGSFTADDGTEVTVDMMHQTAELSYFAGEGYQALQLPYAGSLVSMWIVLPDAGGSSEFEAGLDQAQLAGIAEGFASTRVAVTLPKFHILSELSMRETLQAMGMQLAFVGEGDFSGICKATSIHIDNVYHDADMTVDEAGTEAAAATAVVLLRDGGIDPNLEDPIAFVADRPFVFVLRDDSTGAILFMGRVTDPNL